MVDPSISNPYSWEEYAAMAIHWVTNTFGILANALLLFLVTKKSPVEMHSYSVLLANFALADLLACVSGILVQERIITPGLTLIFIPYGPCNYFGTKTCFVTHCFMMHLYAHSLWSLLLSFIFRLVVINGPSPAQRYVFLIVTCIPAQSPLEKLTPIINERIPQLNLNNRTIMGCEYIFEWKVAYSWLHMLVPWTPIFFAVLFLRYKIIKMITVVSMSEKTKKMHQQLLRALTYQAFLPFTFAIGFFVYFCEFFGLHYEVFEHATYIFVGSIPVLSPLASLFFVSPYRMWIVQMVYKIKRQNIEPNKISAISSI